MIPATNRFRGSRLIELVYKRGRAARVDFLSAKAVTPKTGSYKLAVVVSKKISKSAVVRNKIRRRIFEQFREIFKEKGAPKIDIVVSVYDERAAKVPAGELRKMCEKLLEKLESRLK
ncbi:ribonuclease P protein component [Candidatus Saccharibacteria bacterium]|nr:ribonuclease P protein component [Candidatus Saccharibacteria bacterium]